MHSKLLFAYKYIHYLFNSGNRKGHGIHSPFIYSFIREVLNEKADQKPFQSIANLRTDLLKNRTVVKKTDFGAGSRVNNQSFATISSITKHAGRTAKYGKLLYRMVKKLQPAYVVELGTSLGLSTAYMALANNKSHIITAEGNPMLAEIANQNFEKLGIQNIEIVCGNFDETLPGILKEIPAASFVFVDGNHREEPTMHYFTACLAKANSQSVFVFDDIHWSKQMERAWERIKLHPQVTCTVDLFFMGIVFFRPEFKEKQHFIIRY